MHVVGWGGGGVYSPGPGGGGGGGRPSCHGSCKQIQMVTLQLL